MPELLYWILLLIVYNAGISAMGSDVADDSLAFIAIGDWGMQPGHQDTQYTIAKAMDRLCEDHPCHFIVSTGDNLYSHDGNSFNNTWRDVYSGDHLAHLTWYITLGNHDRGSPGIPTAHHQLAFSKKESRWHLPSPFYSFTKVFAGDITVLFIVLDTTLFLFEPESRREQVAFLTKSLSSSKADYSIVIGHHPVYSTGYYSGETRLREAIVPILEQYQVDVYLCGHDHNLQHLRKEDSHSTGGGPDYVISGGGGGLLYAHRPINTDIVRHLGVRPLIYEYKPGFTYFNINRERIVLEHYTYVLDINKVVTPKRLYDYVRKRREH